MNKINNKNIYIQYGYYWWAGEGCLTPDDHIIHQFSVGSFRKSPRYKVQPDRKEPIFIQIMMINYHIDSWTFLIILDPPKNPMHIIRHYIFYIWKQKIIIIIIFLKKGAVCEKQSNIKNPFGNNPINIIPSQEDGNKKNKQI